MRIVILNLILILLLSLPPCASADIFIRANQLGYLPKDDKKAVIGASEDISKMSFFIRNMETMEIIFSEKIGPSVSGKKKDTPFEFNFIVDFSSVSEPGQYRVEVLSDTVSHPFSIDNRVYVDIIDLLLNFMKVERCGNTEPAFHGPCHLHDATNIDFDVTGGWHDAGDFLKFTHKEAYTTYTLLLAYDLHRDTCGHLFGDKDENGLPDLLDEAKIGLDYLMKVYPNDETFIYKVGDNKEDHRLNHRMPDTDPLERIHRPAYIGFDRRNLAQYAFAMALGAKVFNKIPGYDTEAELYFLNAKRAYQKAMKTGEGEIEKLCLAATELYEASKNPEFLEDAKRLNRQTNAGYWGSYPANFTLAHARLAPYDPMALHKIRNSVSVFLQHSQSNLFGLSVIYDWGSLYVALSSATAGWLYETLSGDQTFSDLQRRIRDFTLGVNPWGVSFIGGVGAVYPVDIHNYTAVSLRRNGLLSSGTFKGAVSLGPVSRDLWEKDFSHKIRIDKDIYAQFQPPACVYHDHFHDYVTNEPCIYGSSEAILFFSFYLRHVLEQEKDADGSNALSPGKVEAGYR